KTVVDIHPHQKLKIETQLEKGSVQELNDEDLPRVGNAVTVPRTDSNKSTAHSAPGAPKAGALADGRPETAVTHATVRATSSPENPTVTPAGSDTTHSTSILPLTRSRSPGNSTKSAELRFETHNRAEKTAGVWVDGQYAGYVKELAGSKKVLLVPGKHEIVVRQPWYEDYVEQPVLQPGEVHLISLALVKDGRAPRNDANGELKIDASPARAAVFVDGAFAGHADEFAGVGNALLLTPGEHRLRIALPGYQPFEAVVGLRPHQKLKVETHLEKEGVQESGAPAGQPGRAPASGSAFAVDGTTNAQ
ncbi:MAG: PEGA domain-containing protein, partial [Acidobacteria bacterium]|nr:PEGA domain-containing protein [Acidobacteriota bacterium]